MHAMSPLTLKPGFDALLDGYELDALAHEASTIFGVHPDYTMALYNPAYARFAAANNGGPEFMQRWGLGANVLAAMPEVLADVYATHFAKALQSGKPWEHDYECSSATHERHFHLKAYPLKGRQGMLFVHALRLEQPHTRELVRASVEKYRGPGGSIAQCAHCRRLRSPTDEHRWDFVPAAVEHPPPGLSHGICEPCAGHYFGSA